MFLGLVSLEQILESESLIAVLALEMSPFRRLLSMFVFQLTMSHKFVVKSEFDKRVGKLETLSAHFTFEARGEPPPDWMAFLLVQL